MSKDFEREPKQQHFITHEFSTLPTIQFINKANQSKKKFVKAGTPL